MPPKEGVLGEKQPKGLYVLKIIESQAHKFHEQKISSLLGLLKIYQNFYLSPEAHDKATFVIAEDDKRGVYGGAVLYPRKISPSLKFMSEDTQDEKLKKIFSSFQPKVKEYWTARTCLCIGHDTSTSLLETVELCQRFYRNLYKAFCYFGEKENTEYLTFTLHTIDTHVDNNLRILTYQTWPYLLEIKLSDNSDGFFHGILSLKGNAFKARRRPQKVLSPRSSPQINFTPEGFVSEEWRVF